MDAANPFGVNVAGSIGLDPALDSTMAAVQQGNISWIRLGLQWNEVPDASDGSWIGDTVKPIRETVAAIESARAHCLNVLLNLSYQTDASTNGGYLDARRVPAMAARWRWERFVSHLAQLASDRGVRYFSIGNENNSTDFTYPHAGWDTTYLALYRLAGAQIRSVNSQNKLVALEWAWSTENVDGYGPDNVKAKGIVDSLRNDGLVDIVAVHAYGGLHDVVDSAMMGGMPSVASTAQGVPVWLTETGPGYPGSDTAGPGDNYRDSIAATIGRFIHFNLFGLDLPTGRSQYPNWQKSFVFRFFSPNYELSPLTYDRGLGTLSGSAYVPRHAYWAYRYLAEQWSQFGAVRYQGFVDTTGRSSLSSYYGWTTGYDHIQYAGTTGMSLPLTGIQVDPLPYSLQQAGMSMCYRGAFNWVVDWQAWICDGSNTGPFPYFSAGQPRALEAFQLSVTSPVAGWDGSPMVACGRAHVGYIGWMTPVCTPQSGGASGDIGQRGTSRQVQAFLAYLNGDIR